MKRWLVLTLISCGGSSDPKTPHDPPPIAPSPTNPTPANADPFAAFDLKAIQAKLQGGWLLTVASQSSSVYGIAGDQLTWVDDPVIFGGKTDRVSYTMRLEAPCHWRAARSDGTKDDLHGNFGIVDGKLFVTSAFEPLVVVRSPSGPVVACTGSDVYLLDHGTCSSIKNGKLAGPATCSLEGDAFTVGTSHLALTGATTVSDPTKWKVGEHFDKLDGALARKREVDAAEDIKRHAALEISLKKYVTEGAPKIKGTGDKAALVTALHAGINGPWQCYLVAYAKSLIKGEAKVDVSLDVGADGKVTVAKVTGVDAETTGCIETKLVALPLPATKAATKVSYQIAFKPPT